MNVEDLIRPNIRRMKPYSSARDEFSGTAMVYLDANENPHQTALNRYPDPHQQKLKEAISAKKNIPVDQIFLGNGSDEPIDLLIRLFCHPGKDNILITDPTYGMYGVSAEINDIAVIKVPLNEDFSLDSSSLLAHINPQTRLIFICSPNNPSGNLLDTNEILKILTSFKGIVVIDEAYIDFAESESFIQRISDFPGLVVLQTFSKAMGLAGARVGMAFSNTTIISYLNKIKPPYNINTASQHAALDAISKINHTNRSISEIISERTLLAKRLSELSVVEHIYPSDSNFMLVRFRNAGNLFKALLSAGIIVRDRSKVTYGTNCLRITVGTKEENAILLKAIEEFDS